MERGALPNNQADGGILPELAWEMPGKSAVSYTRQHIKKRGMLSASFGTNQSSCS
jgi:hypothetical protein